MSNVVHKTKKQGTSLGHIYSPFLTCVLSVSVCLRHPFENENGDTQWESAGLVDKCAGAMEKRKSALYTTAGTGWLTFLLMPSHEPCHFSEDMDRCLPVLTPLWPHRKLHVSLCFQVMARVRMFLGPIYGRIPPPYMSYVESFEWSASAGDSAEETRHSTQRTVYARTSRGRTTWRSFYVSHFTASNESQTRQVACVHVVYSQLSAVFLTSEGSQCVNDAWSTFTALVVVWEDQGFFSALWLYSPSSTLCLLGEGVSWIWSRRVHKQCSEGSREFQLSPAFFSQLPDGSQMFFEAAAALSLCLRSFSPPPPPRVSLSFHIFCPLLLPVLPIFSLSSGITPFAKVLASPCLIVITPRQINSRSPHLFSLFLFCFSLLRLCFSLLLPLSPILHHSSFLWSVPGKWRSVAPITHRTMLCFRCV